MQPPFPISAPAGYAPAFALGYADETGALALVTGATPLPVRMTDTDEPGAAAPPLEGSTSGAFLEGPFQPRPDTPVILALWGTWEGTVQLERTATGGAPRLPTTMAGEPWGTFTANACEPVWVENEPTAELYLAITVTSGTLHYRIAQ